MSTIVTIVAVVVVPLHLIYAFSTRNVIATRDFHDAIEAGPSYRQVRSVGSDQLDAARLAFWIITAIELGAVPLAVRATRRAFEVEDRGSAATAPDAWGHAFTSAPAGRLPRGWIGVAAGGLVAAVAAGLLVHGIGTKATGFLSETWRWAGVGLTQALARAAGAPLALGPLALLRIKADPLKLPRF